MLRAVSFDTDRLQVMEWHSASWPTDWQDDLPRMVLFYIMFLDEWARRTRGRRV